MTPLNRRQALGMLSTGAIAAALAAPATGSEPAVSGGRPLRILVAGAHPGDPEAGCGGTMARYARQGHAVSALYLTRGEAGVSGKDAKEAAAIRTAEAEAACKILGATPIFAGQMDGATEVNAQRQAEFTKLIGRQKPDVLFTHWPVDHHADHRACASLCLGAWLDLKRAFALYYYEVDLGSDTQCFHPTCYVNVEETEHLKRDACMAHQSQDPQGFYLKDHVLMMRFRGMECGKKMAEGFGEHDATLGIPLIAN